MPQPPPPRGRGPGGGWTWRANEPSRTLPTRAPPRSDPSRDRPHARVTEIGSQPRRFFPHPSLPTPFSSPQPSLQPRPHPLPRRRALHRRDCAGNKALDRRSARHHPLAPSPPRDRRHLFRRNAPRALSPCRRLHPRAPHTDPHRRPRRRRRPQVSRNPTPRRRRSPALCAQGCHCRRPGVGSAAARVAHRSTSFRVPPVSI